MHNREMSEGVVASSAAESLESRVLLSGFIKFLDYQSLTPNAAYLYQAIDNGEKLGMQVMVSPNAVKIDGRPMTIVRSILWRENTLRAIAEDYATVSNGSMGLYKEVQSTSSGLLTTVFSPPMPAPAYLQVGRTYVTSSMATVCVGGRSMTGKMEQRLAATGFDRVRVPAGVFSVLRIVTTGSMSVTSGDTRITVTSTSVQWSARGIGSVALETRTVSTSVQNGEIKSTQTRDVRQDLQAYRVPGSGESLSPIKLRWSRLGISA